MIAALAFGASRAFGLRSIRDAGFVPRSTLPVSAACLVANGARETLSSLLAAELDFELVEPAIPGPPERRLLLAGATIARVRGRLCDGFIILRPAAVRRVIAYAFGEGESGRERLSQIERATLDRVVAALVPLCNTLCGTLGAVVRESEARAAADMATYFEVRATSAADFAVGFGITRDPAEEVGGRLTLDDLSDVELDAAVEFARGTLGVPAFARLGSGVTVALETPLGAAGTLRVGGVAVARGRCGIANGRRAIAFDNHAGSTAA